jgi:hypothetical protein
MYIELKAFETPGADSSRLKTKIQLNVGTPFSADTNAEIGKDKLEPKKAYDLLQFIATDLIPRVVIKANQHAFDTELKLLQGMRGNQTWEEFYENASEYEIAEFKRTERAMLDKAIAGMDTYEMPLIQQFNFDELSPGKLSTSLVAIVNGNVPPPRR